MPTRGGRPCGARGISRSFLGKFLNFFFRTFSMQAWVGHLFKGGTHTLEWRFAVPIEGATYHLDNAFVSTTPMREAPH